MLIALYVVAALVAVLGAVYVIKDLAADLLLMGASLALALVCVVARSGEP